MWLDRRMAKRLPVEIRISKRIDGLYGVDE